jgi:hypothetical protein
LISILTGRAARTAKGARSDLVNYRTCWSDWRNTGRAATTGGGRSKGRGSCIYC